MYQGTGKSAEHIRYKILVLRGAKAPEPEAAFQYLTFWIHNGAHHEARFERCTEAEVEDCDKAGVLVRGIGSNPPERPLRELEKALERGGTASGIDGGVGLRLVEDERPRGARIGGQV